MYVVYENDDIIAYHRDLEVVDKYIKNINRNNPQACLKIGKIKNKEFKKMSINNDLLLIRYNKTYIQEGYLQYIELVEEGLLEDEKYARDIIYRILNINKLSKKDSKILMKSLNILEKIIYEDELYTPTISDMKSYKETMDPYIYKYHFDD